MNRKNGNNITECRDPRLLKNKKSNQNYEFQSNKENFSIDSQIRCFSENKNEIDKPNDLRKKLKKINVSPVNNIDSNSKSDSDLVLLELPKTDQKHSCNKKRKISECLKNGDSNNLKVNEFNLNLKKNKTSFDIKEKKEDVDFTADLIIQSNEFQIGSQSSKINKEPKNESNIIHAPLALRPIEFFHQAYNYGLIHQIHSFNYYNSLFYQQQINQMINDENSSFKFYNFGFSFVRNQPTIPALFLLP